MHAVPASSTEQAHRWAVILAGGDGTRLRELSHIASGDGRPKQFCSFFGGQSLLTHTRDRVAPLFNEDNTLFVLARSHEAHYQQQMADVPARRMLIQPSNRGTATAVALSVLEILRRDFDATVAFFPSDHHYQDSSIFRATVNRGLRLARAYPDQVLIIGAPAIYPEEEYGWIQPGRVVLDSIINPLYSVSTFWEKPDPAQAGVLQQGGCLWNTFVTIGLANAFLELLAETLPRLMHSLARQASEPDLERIYNEIESYDFSRHVLSHIPERLLVLRDGPSGWTDFGSPRRALAVLEAIAG